MYIMPTLEPKVHKYDLLWAIRSPRVREVSTKLWGVLVWGRYLITLPLGPKSQVLRIRDLQLAV